MKQVPRLGAVPGRPHVRHRGAHAFVYGHGTVGSQRNSRLPGKPTLRADADVHDDQTRVDGLTSGDHPVDPAVAFNGVDRRRAMHDHAVSSELGLDVFGDLHVNQREDMRKRFDHDHIDLPSSLSASAISRPM